MPARPQPNFDNVASLYRWAEYVSLGPILQQARTHFLPNLHSSRQAFVLGDGDGRFLAKLLHQNSTIRATAVDSSAKMLQLLRTRCLATSPTASERLQTLHASAMTVDPPPQTDLIVSHFFLDCLTQRQLEGLAGNLAARVQPGALWLVSDFDLPPNPILRPLGTLYIRALYLAFRVLNCMRVQQLPAIAPTLSAANFSRLIRKTYLCGLIYTEIWQLQ
jgi:ubiquinone/menaquinone biosynthesis C-methylase UbiE